MIVDPWGKVLVELTGDGQEPEIGIAEIDLKYWERVQREMPLLRRTYARSPCLSNMLADLW